MLFMNFIDVDRNSGVQSLESRVWTVEYTDIVDTYTL